MTPVLKKKFRLYMTGALLALLILMIVGLGYYIIVNLKALEPCMTAAEVEQDPDRCLYIYENNIYELGTLDAPYNDIQCGSDITDLLPTDINIAEEIDPNLKTSLCVEPIISEAPVSGTPSPETPTPPQETVATGCSIDAYGSCGGTCEGGTCGTAGGVCTCIIPTPTAEPTPEAPTPTNTPIPSFTPIPTNTPWLSPTPKPTLTPKPTAVPIATFTPIPTNTPWPSPTPTPTITPEPTSTLTPVPTEIFLAETSPTQPPLLQSGSFDYVIPTVSLLFILIGMIILIL